MKVLNFGSLNIDYVYGVEHFVKKGETISSDSLHVFSGGKGLNQSVALAKAGAEVYHAGVIGQDGTFLLEVLREAGVNTNHILIRDDIRTGNAIIQNDQAGDNCIILFGGANQNVRREEVDRVLDDFDRGDFIVLQNEISEMPYIMKRAHEKGLVMVLNPSPMNEKIWKLPLQYVNYFMLNEGEAAQLIEVESDCAETLLHGLTAKFPEAGMIVTLGERGSVFEENHQTYHQDALVVETVDTTAAGDT
ncbi:MAG: ribokinase, partial [Hungatella sp.]